MNKTLFFKNIAENFPPPIAKIASIIPFQFRLGSTYKKQINLIRNFEKNTDDEKKIWIYNKLKSILEFSYYKIPFYHQFYHRKGYRPEKFKSLEHFTDVPIVTKNDLRNTELCKRSRPRSGNIPINTGGSSGSPLNFYVDRFAFAREWAHMHQIWYKSGYDYRHLKLTFRGRNLGQEALRYNPVHNEYLVNSYSSYEDIASALWSAVDKNQFAWLHGYPSVVADWCRWMSDHEPILMSRIKLGLKGVLLGSEFPARPYRRAIEAIASENIVAWYGHSEMAVLAEEICNNVYRPLFTYGFAEVVDPNSKSTNLIATSLWNQTCPFIRYDTEDRINGKIESGLLKEFSISDGRIGEYVIDKFGRHIGLTALVFGRHHQAFEDARHIQVSQDKPGQMTIYFTPIRRGLDTERLKRNFDFSNVAIDVSLVLVDEPYRTARGKTPLLIPKHLSS